jgi:hypothetical protein
MGLKEGAPSLAALSVVKMYKDGRADLDGDRQGKPLASYVVIGNQSKRRLIGAGIEKKFLVRLTMVDGSGPELGVRCWPLSSVAIPTAHSGFEKSGQRSRCTTQMQQDASGFTVRRWKFRKEE